MQAYFAVPMPFRVGILKVFQAAASSVFLSDPFRLMAMDDGPTVDDMDEEFSVRTIFPFIVATKAGPVTPPHADALYRALNRDMSEFSRLNADPRVFDVASGSYQVGQPVRLWKNDGETAALRVSADARYVVDSWASARPGGSERRVDGHVSNMRRMSAKLELLLRDLETATRPSATL